MKGYATTNEVGSAGEYRPRITSVIETIDEHDKA
jgi:hypothetical protein